MYLSLETDEEFVARIQHDRPWWRAFGLSDAALDHCVWIELQMQRKMIERVTDKPPMPSSVR